ncbi:hypothetical protein [Legionella sp. 227]|uniref:hypothetical protein n=1 Tax=Legionella sp. 227 TaxID=3367288 RepID=UPI00370DE094
MGFKYVEYDLLSKYIRESIATEVKRHKLDEKNLPQALRSLSVSHPERAIQCKYLLKVLACLDKSTSHDKTLVLYAAAFYIRDQIFASYQGTVTSFFLSPENSTLYNQLTTSLNLDRENFPDSKNLLEMYEALSSFMHAHVYVDGDSSNGYLDKSKQLFSSQKIKNYKVETVLKDLVKKIAGLKLEQIEKAKEQDLKASELGQIEKPKESQLKESDKKIRQNQGFFTPSEVTLPVSDAAASKEYFEEAREPVSVQCN